MGTRRKKPEGTKNAKRTPKRVSKPSNPNKIITPGSSKGVIYVGIDVHKMSLQVAAVDRDGVELLNKKIKTDHPSVKRFFSKFPRNRTRCVMESSSVWYGLYRYMTDTLKLDVVLSNPYQTKAIAASKKKTDKVDARILADLLRGGYIAECYVPDTDTVESRQLGRYRHVLVRSRTRYKNLIHSILLQKGIKIPGAPFAQGYIKALRRIGDYRIDGYLEEIASHDRRIAEADVRVQQTVKESEDATLLTSIPGVGKYSALVISAEIGDISRFPDSHKLCAYAGIVPSVRNSAETVHHGRITKRGSSVLRWVLTEAVHSHARYAPDSDLAIFYRRISKRRGTSKSAVAAASKMLRVIYCMLSEGREFVPRYGQDCKRGYNMRKSLEKITA